MVVRTIPIIISGELIRWLVCWLMPFVRRFPSCRNTGLTTNPVGWNNPNDKP
jgi:hypothetical protein